MRVDAPSSCAMRIPADSSVTRDRWISKVSAIFPSRWIPDTSRTVTICCPPESRCDAVASEVKRHKCEPRYAADCCAPAHDRIVIALGASHDDARMRQQRTHDKRQIIARYAAHEARYLTQGGCRDIRRIGVARLANRNHWIAPTSLAVAAASRARRAFSATTMRSSSSIGISASSAICAARFSRF